MDERHLEIVARAKAELRKRLRALRQTTPAAALARRSERVVENLRAHEAIARAASVALFFPIEARHEVDLRPLDAELRARGARIAYPALGEPAFRFAAPSELERDPIGFHGAPLSAPLAEELDVIVVPALALDETGKRLGYGVGFYDRLLPRFPGAVKIGVAYDFQLLVEVPVTADDVPVDAVVTDARTIHCGPREN